MKRVDVNSVTGLIFAGNNGFSINDTFMPKSLLETNGKTLLEYTLENVVNLGLSEIYVFCDDYVDLYKQLVEKFKNVKLMVCDNYDSTFTIIQNHISFIGEYFFFLYGNSPKSTRQLRDMMYKNEEIVVTTYEKSSKANLININDRFLEPPYFIKRSAVYDSPAITWLTFFMSNKNKIVYCKDNGPNEFNSLEEFDLYKEYIRKRF